MVKTYGALYRQTRKALLPTEGEQASVTARELLCRCSGKSPAQLLADGALYASEETEAWLEDAVARLRAEEPLAYILGEWDFYGLTLRVTRDTLIPRDDTMAVTELALAYARRLGGEVRVLDLCTGTGCIGLAIASQLPQTRVTLSDCSAAALRVARENVMRCGLARRVSCVPLDVRRAAPEFLGVYDLITANPPYITAPEMAELPDSVRLYEPELALYGGGDGLDLYRAIAENYAPALKADGRLCLEFGKGQERDVCAILERGGFCPEELRKDTRGITRAVIARRIREDA